MNGPNVLSLLRIVMAFIFMVCVLIPQTYAALMALLMFVLACATDFIDGYWARSAKIETSLGALLDPLADKVLITAALVTFVDLGYVVSWVVVLVLAREFCVTGLRLMAIKQGIVVAASVWGKMKTVMQMMAVLVILLFHLQIIYQAEWLAFYHFRMIIYIVTWAMLLVTVLSGWTYAVGCKSLWTKELR